MTSPNDGILRRPAPLPQGGFFSGGFGRGLLGGFIGAGIIRPVVRAWPVRRSWRRLVDPRLGSFRSGFCSCCSNSSWGLFADAGRQSRRAAFDSSAGQGSARPDQARREASRAGGGPGTLREAKLEIAPADFSVFEQRLVAIQSAYGAEDFDRLRALATPEMASYFAEELAGNAKKGLVNRLSDVTFLQGDLSEAWREEQGEYATVAMRYSLIDTMADRVAGKIVSGDPATPQQATEVWTFTRHVGGAPDDWKLSAIQQA